MFESLRLELIEQAEVLVGVGSLDEVVRGFLGTTISPEDQQALSAFEKACYDISPQRLAWRIYDHCAAVTRIYSLLDIFMSDLVREICEEFPKQLAPYSKLPERLRRSHRRGFGKVILELEEKRYHQDLRQADLLQTYQRAFLDEIPYKLIPEAFLVSKRAYRLPQILELTADLGMYEFEQQVINNAQLSPYVQTGLEYEQRRESIQKQLNDFIDARNMAAHEEVDNVWPHERMRYFAYFVRDLCLSMLDAIERSFLARDIEANSLLPIGEVTEVFHQGVSAIIPNVENTVRVGDEIVIIAGDGFRLAIVTSLRLDDLEVLEVQGNSAPEVGLRSTTKLHKGNKVFGHRATIQKLEVTLPAQDGAEEENGTPEEIDSPPILDPIESEPDS